MIPLEEDLEFLEHFGVKGMHWGVRKKEEPTTSETKKMSKGKKLAIILGSAAVLAATAGGAYYVNKHLKGSARNLPAPTAAKKKFVESLVQEPTHIVHSSRGKNRGYAFLRDGGVNDPEGLFAKIGMDRADVGFFKRLNDGSVAARFLDPKGRKDFSGRPIGHDVLIPASMARDIKGADDAAKVAWPHIKDLFEPYYRSERDTYGPGF